MSMKMSIKDLPKHRREEITVLEILRRNFREQKQSVNKSGEVMLDIPIGDVDIRDHENVSPQKFCRVAHSLKEKGVTVRQFDQGDVQSEISRSHFPDEVAFCTVTVSAKFEEICEKLMRESWSGTPSSPIGTRLIEKDAKGRYLYNGNVIKMGVGTIYYKIFDAVYSLHDQNDFTSYEAIEQYLAKHEELESKSDEERNKRINNGVNDQLFRFAKVNGQLLKNISLTGEELI